ncbi:uncharacterized protein LOC131028835 isoform X2 [Cryptomeria japonica]|uniref:uncharacterized protein LOC131028835 isoform X2 n=1 Tax=Cryptomeria japonica TaxID=3369 RepID=UPI0027DA83D2|nr:uncharacterized protein LOC131028835 isoform X2 [Cryptomeria japonica]
MACCWVSHQHLRTLWRPLSKLEGIFPQVIERQESSARSHISVHVQERYFSASLNLKESFKLLDYQNPPRSYELSKNKKSTIPVVIETGKINNPAASEVNSNGAGSTSSARLMLIDGTHVVYRAYYKIMANLRHGGLQHADGNGDWVLTIFKAISIIVEMLELLPSHVAVVFDYDGEPCCYNPNDSWQQVQMSKGLTFRHTMYPAYKGNRIPTPDTVVQALQYLKAALMAMSLKVIEVPGVEADDVIATLAVNGVAAGAKVRIVSPDKDFFQIICPSVRLLRIAPRGTQVVSFGIEQFAEKYGDLKPSQIVDVMALVGDPSDNIPGSLENLFQNLDKVSERNIQEALLSDNGQAFLSKDLATLRWDLPFYMVPFKTTDLLYKKPEDQGEKFVNLLRAMRAYAQGSSSKFIETQIFSLWEKY